VALAIGGLAAGVIAWKGAYMADQPIPLLLGLLTFALTLRMFYQWELGRVREEAFKQIPDAVGLMVRAVRAGLPVGEAIRSVAREMPEPTRGEFQRVIAETGIGATLERALWGVYQRTGLREYAFLATVIGLQSQTGGSLAEALDNLADIVRKRVAMVGKANALAGQAKASAAILVALPPFSGGAIALIRPDYLTALFSDPRGMNLLATAIIMLTAGILVIRGLIRRSVSD
jgi:tight adherence protein B